MKMESRPRVDSVNLTNNIGHHLRNAGFYEDVIDEIVEALELKSEINKFKEEQGIPTF
jgi:hypothetical protein